MVNLSTMQSGCIMLRVILSATVRIETRPVLGSVRRTEPTRQKLLMSVRPTLTLTLTISQTIDCIMRRNIWIAVQYILYRTDASIFCPVGSVRHTDFRFNVSHYTYAHYSVFGVRTRPLHFTSIFIRSGRISFSSTFTKYILNWFPYIIRNRT